MARKPATLGFWVGRLPHWEVEDGRYFITLHTAGAIPKLGRDRIRAIAEELNRCSVRHSPDWLQRQRWIFREMERWLDRAVANSVLAQPDVASVIADAIRHRHQRGDWKMFEYVIMPTHIHLFCEIGQRGLKNAMEDFKRWTAHRAMPLLANHPAMNCKRDPRLWQREWFDHWSRSDEEDDRIVRYIRTNPEAAKLVANWEQWPFGSWSHP